MICAVLSEETYFDKNVQVSKLNVPISNALTTVALKSYRDLEPSKY
jgi:hypothetical protein